MVEAPLHGVQQTPSHPELIQHEALPAANTACALEIWSLFHAWIHILHLVAGTSRSETFPRNICLRHTWPHLPVLQHHILGTGFACGVPGVQDHLSPLCDNWGRRRRALAPEPCRALAWPQPRLLSCRLTSVTFKATHPQHPAWPRHPGLLSSSICRPCPRPHPHPAGTPIPLPRLPAARCARAARGINKTPPTPLFTN